MQVTVKGTLFQRHRGVYSLTANQLTYSSPHCRQYKPAIQIPKRKLSSVHFLGFCLFTIMLIRAFKYCLRCGTDLLCYLLKIFVSHKMYSVNKRGIIILITHISCCGMYNICMCV